MKNVDSVSILIPFRALSFVPLPYMMQLLLVPDSYKIDGIETSLCCILLD